MFAQTKYGLLDSLSKYEYTKGGEFDAPGTDDSQGWTDMKDTLTIFTRSPFFEISKSQKSEHDS